jgi:hypothetical protein
MRKTLVGKPEGKEQLGIPRRSWEGNITMDPREIGLSVRINGWPL